MPEFPSEFRSPSEKVVPFGISTYKNARIYAISFPRFRFNYFYIKLLFS